MELAAVQLRDEDGDMRPLHQCDARGEWGGDTHAAGRPQSLPSLGSRCDCRRRVLGDSKKARLEKDGGGIPDATWGNKNKRGTCAMGT